MKYFFHLESKIDARQIANANVISHETDVAFALSIFTDEARGAEGHGVLVSVSRLRNSQKCCNFVSSDCGLCLYSMI